MEYPAVFPWQALPSIVNAAQAQAPYDIPTILAIASRRKLTPVITEHFAQAVLDHLKDISVDFGGGLSKAQAVAAARACIEEESKKFDCAYLGKEIAEASLVQRELILGIIEDAIEGSALRGPSGREVDRVEGELKRATTDKIKEVEESQEDKVPGVRAVEMVKNGRHTTKFVFSQVILDKHFNGKDPYTSETTPIEQLSALNLGANTYSASNNASFYNGKDLLTAICSSIELAVELGKYLAPEDILNLYIASGVFRLTINNYMLSSVKIWIKHRCPEAGHVFPFNLYKRHLILDPTGRTWGQIYKEHAPASLTFAQRDKVRTIPGMKYLQLVMGRDKIVREILAIMAREGYLMPEGMYNTLLRMWLLMDVTTTEHRRAMLRNAKLWTDQDLYNGQMFFVKLAMHMNDPIFGPGTLDLMQLFIGQKGLYRLWQLLFRKRFTTLPGIIELKVRYNYELDNGQWQRCLTNEGKCFHGVPMLEVGLLHREGYGTMETKDHLCRPDELIPQEAVTRGLELERHIRHMMLWGYFNWETGQNIVPTEEQIHLDDEDDALQDMDPTHHWRRRHAMKARWNELSEEQKQDIQEDDEDETLRCQAWGYNGEEDDYDSDLNDYSSDSDSAYSLNDEIRRGVCVPQQAKDKPSEVPAKDDKEGWTEFVNRVLVGAPPKLDLEWMQRLHDDNEVNDERFDERFDWKGWMKEEGLKLEDFMVLDEDEEEEGEGDTTMV